MNDKAVWIESNCGGTSKLMTSTDEPGKCIVIKEISTTNFEQKIGTRYYQVFIEANNQCIEYRERLRYLVGYSEGLTTLINDLIEDVYNTFQVALDEDNKDSGVLGLIDITYIVL